MQITEIRQLLQAFPESQAELVETHISWVILVDQFAYKIKKPVRFSFLDFSTAELRQTYCVREVELNRRLTKDIYLGVVTIRRHDGGISIGQDTGEILEYAVKMRRLPKERQMDLLLAEGQVTPGQVEQIAEQLALFHKSAEIPALPPDPEAMLRDFADLSGQEDMIASRYGSAGRQSVRRAVAHAGTFLHAHAYRIRERYNMGFFIDGHGDLHSKNIFLLEQPVIFDCIEFNDHFRYVDVLDELAFFCLDLELFGATALAKHFMDHYLNQYPCMVTPEDALLYHYFQLYRAGVKLKINLIKATESPDTSDRQFRWGNADGYFRLFQRYLDRMAGEEAGTA